MVPRVGPHVGSMNCGKINTPAKTRRGTPAGGAVFPHLRMAPRAVQCAACATTHGTLFLQQPGKIEMQRYTCGVSSGRVKVTFVFF